MPLSLAYMAALCDHMDVMFTNFKSMCCASHVRSIAEAFAGVQAVNSGILGGFSAFDVRALSEGHHQELQRLRNVRSQQAAQAAMVSQQQQQQQVQQQVQQQQLLQQQLLRQNQVRSILSASVIQNTYIAMRFRSSAGLGQFWISVYGCTLHIQDQYRCLISFSGCAAAAAATGPSCPGCPAAGPRHTRAAPEWQRCRLAGGHPKRNGCDEPGPGLAGAAV